ncbi:hypothetical protein GE107_14375 [Cohnella sp. CFH 77786]|uniref:SOS response-associated peptidase family protein n=1 Tax=Cohnella sp. CFH 77786 TaxID=2662265 RepID=UPI001C610486|nr:SOS response-associated peptidase family protein [Cohnella sp. CFH 77786]MBW5447239.1 hypothetical protein [Cohnella sp. CFH 77786]
MNERYSLAAELADLTAEFRVDRIEFPYYENEYFQPTGQIPVIRPVGGVRCLSGQRWGLMPYWGKSSIHADRDTLGDKPYLLSMLAKKRCVVPCSGLLFERIEGKTRKVYRRERPGKKVFGAAGIYDVWLDSEKNEYPMCTIISLSASSPEGGAVPLVLEGEALDTWLDPLHNTADAMREFLLAVPETDFRVELVAEGK